MPEKTYLKVPFVWEPKLLTTSQRLTCAVVSTMHDHLLVSIIARAMSSSVDASNRAKVSEHGAYAVAEMFLYSATEGFSYRDE
jgi:hypothetical protein